MSTEVELGRSARCRTCRATIVFARTLGGKVCPFERRDDGPMVIVDGIAQAYVAPSPQLQLLGNARPATPAGTPRYVSHFASCPDANEHRKIAHPETT